MGLRGGIGFQPRLKGLKDESLGKDRRACWIKHRKKSFARQKRAQGLQGARDANSGEMKWPNR